MELNLNYLMRRQSRKLHTIIRRFNKDNILLAKVCMRTDINDDKLFSNYIYNHLTDMTLSDVPFLCAINENFIYTEVKTPTDIFIIGPILYNPDYSIKNSLSITIDPDDLDDLINTVVTIGWNELIDCLLDFANTIKLTEDPDYEITDKDLVNLNCIGQDFTYKMRQNLENKIFDQQESGQHHNPYDQEVRELSAIENGDIDALKKSLAEDYTGQIGTLAKDSLRNIKNIALVVIATSSRAAIRGGLSPEIAFSMSDLYSLQVEEATTENLPQQITRNAEFEFAKMVHQLKTEKIAMNSFSGEENEHVMAAKNYIFKHLHGKITVAEIAEVLGLNANYLSEIFKKHEKISLKEYILNNKITLVKNLLNYSAYSYSEISYYLGFSSQSHLGKQFKEKTGMTLSQYRLKYQMQEFMD